MIYCILHLYKEQTFLHLIYSWEYREYTTGIKDEKVTKKWSKTLKKERRSIVHGPEMRNCRRFDCQTCIYDCHRSFLSRWLMDFLQPSKTNRRNMISHLFFVYHISRRFAYLCVLFQRGDPRPTTAPAPKSQFYATQLENCCAQGRFDIREIRGTIDKESITGDRLSLPPLILFICHIAL